MVIPRTILIRTLALVGLALVLTEPECWAAGPYQPVHSDPAREPWRWRSFPELDGLGLRCMAEDSTGNMWFGVDDGVRRYDGMTWMAFTAPDGPYGPPVNVLLATRDGTVYVGTDMGISRFSEGAWSRVFPPEGDLPWPIDTIMESSDRSVWAATAWGALHLDQQSPTLYTTKDMGSALRVLAPDVPLSIVPDETAPTRSWGEGIGAKVIKGSYLGKRRGKAPMVVWALASGGPGEIAGLKVGDLIHRVDTILPSLPHLALGGPAGTEVTLVVERVPRPEPFEVKITRDLVEGGVPDFSISDVYEDRDGRLWFGLTWGGEILSYSSRATGSSGAATWQLYTTADGLEIGTRPKLPSPRMASSGPSPMTMAPA